MKHSQTFEPVNSCIITNTKQTANDVVTWLFDNTENYGQMSTSTDMALGVQVSLDQSHIMLNGVNVHSKPSDFYYHEHGINYWKNHFSMAQQVVSTTSYKQLLTLK